MKVGFLSSSVGKKVTMSLTGLFLSVFLIAHAIGNLQLFVHDQGLAFNTYAAFMSTNIFIEIISWGLYIILVYHILRGLWLGWENYQARPMRYRVSHPQANSAWYSRSMVLLGVILLVFIVVHLANFWYPYKIKNATPYSQYAVSLFDPMHIEKKENISTLPPAITAKKIEIINPQDGVKIIFIRDMYKEVKYTFENELWVVILYIIAMFVLAFHLIHGIQSAFQTLGLVNAGYAKIVKWVGVILFGIIIPFIFAIMPLFFYFKIC